MFVQVGLLKARCLQTRLNVNKKIGRSSKRPRIDGGSIVFFFARPEIPA